MNERFQDSTGTVEITNTGTGLKIRDGGISLGTAGSPPSTPTAGGISTTTNIQSRGGSVTSADPTSGVGYATNAGGTVTQLTNRTTGVTLNKVCGAITTDTTSLAAEAAAEFTVTNSAVAATDVVVASIKSGSNGGNTDVIVSGVAAGSFNLKVCNNNPAAGTAETGAIIINFAVIKAVTA